MDLKNRIYISIVLLLSSYIILLLISNLCKRNVITFFMNVLVIQRLLLTAMGTVISLMGSNALFVVIADILNGQVKICCSCSLE